MPVNEKYIQDFIEDEYIHIICKSVSGSLLFKSDENRIYFLKKYAAYTSGYLDTYSYILLDNHSHFLVKCINSDDLKSYLSTLNNGSLKSHQKKYLLGKITYSEAVEFQMKDFFIAYAMAFNKENNRSGSLFINPFRRIRINDDAHLQQIVIYIHANVLKHNTRKKFEDYRWSSYLSILSDKATLLKRKEIIDFFETRNNFILQHRTQSQYFYNCEGQLE